jgi:predicted RNA-binding Zn ribbon-like protein
MATPNQAPGQLEHVRQFVNTFDLETGADKLDSPEVLASWLRERDLAPEGVEVGPESLEIALELREALRRLLLANNGAPLEPDAVDTLNEAIADASLSIRFDAEGNSTLKVKGSKACDAVAPIAAVVYEAMVDGTWSRLKACPAGDCHWAFYDRSRNRSGTWCDMRVCGNRAKVRAYRERHAGPEPAAGTT